MMFGIPVKMMKPMGLTIALATVLAFAACGGGDAAANQPPVGSAPTSIPRAATATATSTAPTPQTTVTPTSTPRAATATAASTAPTPQTTVTPTSVKLNGNIEIDGSSTVFPISQAVAEEFRKTQPSVQIPVGISGTGGGFKRFVAGETDISDASRPISTSEKDNAAKNGIEYVELAVAYDGLSILVNPKNTWLTCITTAELKKIWDAGSTVKRWNQVRPEWPDQPLRLYGPGTDSGTFDYFTEVINGKAKKSRADYNASEDDNTLVQGIAGDNDALGYFGFAYYEQNQDKLKLVAVDEGKGKGCVSPAEMTINDGTYTPLSRLLYIYVSKKSLARLEVRSFTEYYLKNAAALSAEVGYVALPQQMYDDGLAKIK